LSDRTPLDVSLVRPWDAIGSVNKVTIRVPWDSRRTYPRPWDLRTESPGRRPWDIPFVTSEFVHGTSGAFSCVPLIASVRRGGTLAHPSWRAWWYDTSLSEHIVLWSWLLSGGGKQALYLQGISTYRPPASTGNCRRKRLRRPHHGALGTTIC
jgi:hypothetical protein